MTAFFGVADWDTGPETVQKANKRHIDRGKAREGTVWFRYRS